jgi:hypothetical protein
VLHNRADSRAPLARPDHARDHYPGWGFPCLSEAQVFYYQQPIYIYFYSNNLYIYIISSNGRPASFLLRTTLPRITRSALFPPVSIRGARSCRVAVSLPISTTEETHETRYRVGHLASFSYLFHMRVTCSIYRDAIALRAIFGICSHNPSLGFLNTPPWANTAVGDHN